MTVEVDAIWKIVITLYLDMRMLNKLPVTVIEREEQGLGSWSDCANPMRCSTTMEDNRPEPVCFLDELASTEDLFGVSSADDDGDVRERMRM